MPSRNKSLSWYGQIRCKDNRKAAEIWRSRDVEPEPCEPAWTADHYVTDMVLEAEKQHGADLWGVFARVYKNKDSKEATVIIHRFYLGSTLEETAKHVGSGVTTSRVSQIEKKALRRVRAAIRGTPLGEAPYYCRGQIPGAKHPGYAWEVTSTTKGKLL